MSGPDPTDALADFAAGLALRDVPPEVAVRVKQCFLDTIGAAYLGATRAESTDKVLAGVRSADNAVGEVSVIGIEQRFARDYAVFLNGTFAHSLDFDDTSDESTVHPGVVVLPVALAVAEQLDSSGEDLLAAMVAGYEVACRIGAALGESAYQRGFHITALAGAFAATAVGARLRGLPAATLCDAWGLVGSMAAGSMQYLENGSWNKRLHPGLAGRSALFGLSLAEAGVRGATQALSGRHGLLRGYSDQPDPRRLVDRLGSVWTLLTTSIKAYPSCRMTHGAIDAVRELRAGGQLPGPGTALRIRLSPTAYRIVGGAERNTVRPSNTVEAQFSVNFQAAVAWREGTVEWPSYELLGDRELMTLAASITTEPDESLPVTGAVALLDTPDGTVRVRVDETAAGPESAANWELAESKLRSAAAPADDLVALVRRLEDLPNSAELLKALRELGPAHA